MRMSIFSTAAGLGIIASGIACSSFRTPAMFTAASTMEVSPDIPAARGQVKYAKTENGNTSIDLTVDFLADPQKLSPPATTYVVWVLPENGDAPPQNIGALKVDENRQGNLKTMTPLTSFELFVTAENSSQITVPSGKRLLWTTHRP